MKKPSHATVVAYLAMFVALGGTTIAAQDRFGASDLERLNVRRAQQNLVVGGVEAACRQNEKLIGGGGGFLDVNPPGLKTLEESRPATQQNEWQVRGNAQAAGGGTLRAFAICLPK